MICVSIIQHYGIKWKKRHEEFILGHILQNISRGQSEGLFKKDIKAPIISRFFASNSLVVTKAIGQKIENILDEEWVLENVKYHICGIASSKGIEKLKSYTKAT